MALETTPQPNDDNANHRRNIFIGFRQRLFHSMPNEKLFDRNPDVAIQFRNKIKLELCLIVAVDGGGGCGGDGGFDGGRLQPMCCAVCGR